MAGLDQSSMPFGKAADVSSLLATSVSHSRLAPGKIDIATPPDNALSSNEVRLLGCLRCFIPVDTQ